MFAFANEGRQTEIFFNVSLENHKSQSVNQPCSLEHVARDESWLKLDPIQIPLGWL